MSPLRMILVLTLACGPAMASIRTSKYLSGGRTITYETFDYEQSNQPTLILLPGTSGPYAEMYRAEATFFAANGYRVLLLHYFDAAQSHEPKDDNYKAWATALLDLVHVCSRDADRTRSGVYILGLSLGASIALAAGSQGLPVKAIAEWYGSLPDDFFHRFQGMPPLLILHGQLDRNISVMNAEQLLRLCQLKSLICESHLYPDQSHGFMGEALKDAEERTLSFFKQHP